MQRDQLEQGFIFYHRWFWHHLIRISFPISPLLKENFQNCFLLHKTTIERDWKAAEYFYNIFLLLFFFHFISLEAKIIIFKAQKHALELWDSNLIYLLTKKRRMKSTQTHSKKLTAQEIFLIISDAQQRKKKMIWVQWQLCILYLYLKGT